MIGTRSKRVPVGILFMTNGNLLIFMKMANIPKKTIEPLLKDVTLDDFELEVK